MFEDENGEGGGTSTLNIDLFTGSHVTGCGCPGCMNDGVEITDDVATPSDASLDTAAGGTYRGRPVWTVDQVAAYLNRTNQSWAPGPAPNHPTPNSGSVDVIRFGFFGTQAEVYNNGYGFTNPANGRPTAYSEYFNFGTFSEAQRAAARQAMESWDDLIAPSLVETSANDADINFGNLANAPTTQAYAYLPTSQLSTNPAINSQIREISGDIWVSASQLDNRQQLDEGRYGMQTLTHEIGHALGLSHPGVYNAGSGGPITYLNSSDYAQDSRVYTVMSYFNANETGARHFDFHVHGTAFSATPLIHDIAAIQRIYGADMTTRTGDTTYGFNSNAGRDSYDFNLTTAPIMAIWDAGGNDTLDASGYSVQQLIDLTPGSLSSIGGVRIEDAPSFEQVNANRAAAGMLPISRATYDANMAVLATGAIVGRLTDNVGIAYGVIIENAVGGSGSDAIIGNQVANVLTGNAGDDILMGRDGNDTLNGGEGNDVLDGGAGDDVMTGGMGNDTYVIDSLGDRANEVAGGGTDTIETSLANFTLGSVYENLTGTLATGQRLTGNTGNNVIQGAAGDDRIDGGTGNDRLLGGDGLDTILGGSGDDFLFGQGGADNLDSGSGDDRLDGGEGADVISAGSGADYVRGGAGDDRIDAGSGDDFILGGAGNDTLTGGSGSDVFVFQAGFGNDRITDFRAGDVLDISALLNAGLTYTNTRVGSDTVLTFSDGSSITLQGASSSSFRGDWLEDDFGASTLAGHQADWMLAA